MGAQRLKNSCCKPMKKSISLCYCGPIAYRNRLHNLGESGIAESLIRCDARKTRPKILKPATRNGRGLFCFLEVVMQPGQQLTKRDERREMQKLIQERENRTPERPEPNWVVDFWLSRRSVLT